MSLQRELDELQDVRRRDKERESRRIQDDEDEIQILRDRCEKLESERAMNPGGEVRISIHFIEFLLTLAVER